MSSNHTPWTSVADVMSGFVVIVLVLFAVATTMHRFDVPPAPPRTATSMERPVDPVALREQQREAFLARVDEALGPYRSLGVVRFDRRARLLEFADVSFRSASACLTRYAQNAVDAIASLVAQHLEDDPELTIQVEGHTDPRSVSRLTKACGWFADNTQLSTVRATNVRNRIAMRVSASTRARLPVTGWGADRPRNAQNPVAPENRRVELHFVWSAASDAGAASATSSSRPGIRPTRENDSAPANSRGPSGT